MFVTIEIIDNETTAMSTHVLPTKDQLERADVTLWDFLLPRVAAQYTPAIVDPVGDRRSTWWVLAELGRRLGYELVAARWVEKSHDLPAPWVERHIDRLGGWRLAPRLLVDQLAALAEGAPLVLVPRRQARHLNSQLDYLGESPHVLLNPDDAAAAGVLDGQEVVVRSAHGELVATAKVDPNLRGGSVSVPHGHQRANVNQLTGKDDIDAITGMARYSGVPVSLEPVRRH